MNEIDETEDRILFEADMEMFLDIMETIIQDNNAEPVE